MSTCNICGSRSWGDQGHRIRVRCLSCGSLERTRALKLHLDRLGIPRLNNKVLHIAPERGLSEFFRERVGDGYDPVDIAPEVFDFCNARRFDLCQDAELLPSFSYDLVVHGHVLEHVPCNFTAILFHLHRALKPNGYHVFCIPILRGEYEEDLRVLSQEEACARFGQNDHVRRFGRADLSATLGMVFNGDLESHRIGACFDDNALDAANIPASERDSLNGTTVFVFRKHDIRLA